MGDFKDFKSRVGIILLAAGSSSRLGQSKQLLDVEGQPLLRRSVETAYACTGHNTMVVLGAQHELHKKVIEHLPVHVIVNKHWENGIGNSLKAGLKSLANLIADLEAIMVMVCDQPLVTKPYLDKLIQAHTLTGQKIVASAYASTLGVPALFHRSLFDSILKLDDQHGAKKIIESNRELVKTIEFPDGMIDIDTKEDYTSYRNSRDRKTRAASSMRGSN
jgi:molybdenum cofactor cytidylyltransferase